MKRMLSTRFKRQWEDPEYRERILKTLAKARASVDDIEKARGLARTRRTKELKRHGGQ